MIVAPDMTVVARQCILDGLAALGVPAQPVSTRTPNPRPTSERFITFQVLGGRKKNLRIAQHMVVALVHDKVANEVACRRAAYQVAAVLEDAANTVGPVLAAAVESVVASDDPSVSAACRYQVTVSWTVSYPTTP
ncbi:hypothetical protein [Tsukamurella tyrosinosolvens]|uniref:hypothetical protein n=1 Tax=Tsukamurella tyrosinosolvens TaxID=57704 RepID=UPI002DD41D27|nr:hypothetical protein [Tsukamurella tyrosinosolvens]MEC4616196.1 hypothetical protein [Tsukamurella tyrosinosolvens]